MDASWIECILRLYKAQGFKRGQLASEKEQEQGGFIADGEVRKGSMFEVTAKCRSGIEAQEQ